MPPPVPELGTQADLGERVILLASVLLRRPALDARTSRNQKEHSAKLGFVDLGGAGHGFEENVSCWQPNSWFPYQGPHRGLSGYTTAIMLWLKTASPA